MVNEATGLNTTIDVEEDTYILDQWIAAATVSSKRSKTGLEPSIATSPVFPISEVLNVKYIGLFPAFDDLRRIARNY